jgi:hypothetical protein
MDADASGQRHDEGHLSELQKAQKDLLWSGYMEDRTQARHVDTLTTSAVSTVLLLSSALTAVITLDGEINGADLALCWIIVILGALTTLFSISFLMRHDLLMRQAQIWKRELDRLFFADKGYGISLLAANRAEIEWHLGRYYLLSRLFWIVISVFITIAGIILIFKAIA